MLEPVTYYSRDGVDYAVFALTLADLYRLAVLTIGVDAAATMPGLDDQVTGAIAHLEARRVVPDEKEDRRRLRRLRQTIRRVRRCIHGG